MPGFEEVKSTTPLPTLEQSLQTIHDFLDAFPVEHLEEHSWELISTAFTSEMSDAWTHLDRGNMLQLYKHLSKLGYALAVVDDRFWRSDQKRK